MPRLEEDRVGRSCLGRPWLQLSGTGAGDHVPESRERRDHTRSVLVDEFDQQRRAASQHATRSAHDVDFAALDVDLDDRRSKRETVDLGVERRRLDVDKCAARHAIFVEG